MTVFGSGSQQNQISLEEAKSALFSALDRLGPRKRVLIVPPDATRLHSQAGPLTEAAWEYYGDAVAAILPALGTHTPMTQGEIAGMFRKVPPRLFQVHDWRSGLATLGEVPGEFVAGVSEGRVDYPIPIHVDRLFVEGRFDLILSIGQVVPHEVAGMAGHIKNIFIGAGGAEAIHRTHFLGAAYGMERIMGRPATPVRRVLDYAGERFAGDLPILHVLTVIGRDAGGGEVIRGLFVGDDGECFRRAADLAREVNIELVDAPLDKAVVYLDPAKYRSTWLGNKAIYRTRMALTDGAELIVLAPGVSRFGEDQDIDTLIRRYGYAGTPRLLDLVKTEPDLAESLCAAAHLIHGSTEGRFTVTYCPGGLTKEEVEGVGFRFGALAEMTARYDPSGLRDGFNTLPDGERIFYVSNPALGLWAVRDGFSSD